MDKNILKHKLVGASLPDRLRRIPQPPAQLFCLGTDLGTLLQKPVVGIVGSRKVSPYGRAVTEQLASELARRGIVIVSGLALGVDSIAHKAAVDERGQTIAVLPGGLDRVYPRSHVPLAKQILQTSGVLCSEYPSGTEAFKQNFIARNRIIAALSDVLLITEAAEKSGSLHTASFAMEQGTTVMAVPGNITSVNSAGTNNLIKTGALPVTSVEDILLALGIEAGESPQNLNLALFSPEEKVILELLQTGISDGEELVAQAALDIRMFNQTLTMLEINGYIKALGNNRWRIN